MDTVRKDALFTPEPEEELATTLTNWLSVSGDVDDFIFFGDTSREQSEK